MKVIVDTDFLNHILNTKNGENTLETIVNYFDYELVMHPWVYNREIKNIKSNVQMYVEKNVEILDYKDFLIEDDRIIYKFEFEALFEEMNHKKLNLGKQDFSTYNKSGENLGEIHSVILARFTNMPVLLSDDYNAKEIAAKRLNSQGYKLEVRNSFDLLIEIIANDKERINRNDALELICNYKQKVRKQYIKSIEKMYK